MANPFRRRRHWYLRWRDGRGVWRQRKTSARTLSEAKELQRAMERTADRQRAGLEALPADCELTLWELCFWWLVHHCPLPSQKIAIFQLRKHIGRNPLGKVKLAVIHVGDIRQRLREMELAGAKPATLNKLRNYLHAAFERAREAAPPLWPGFNPVAQIRAFRVPRRVQETLTLGEISRFIAAVPEPWRDFIGAAITTGLRKGELCGLRKGDVFLEDGKVLVQRSYGRDTTKGGEPMAIPINSAARPIFERALNSPGAYCFPGARGQMRSPESDPHQVVREALHAAGIPKTLTLHGLRHSFATIALRAGAPLSQVSRLLRHKRASTTDAIYSHLQVEDLRAASELVAPKEVMPHRLARPEFPNMTSARGTALQAGHDLLPNVAAPGHSVASLLPADFTNPVKSKWVLGESDSAPLPCQSSGTVTQIPQVPLSEQLAQAARDSKTGNTALPKESAAPVLPADWGLPP